MCDFDKLIPACPYILVSYPVMCEGCWHKRIAGQLPVAALAGLPTALISSSICNTNLSLCLTQYSKATKLGACRGVQSICCHALQKGIHEVHGMHCNNGGI
jgi:hypothetical protein